MKVGAVNPSLRGNWAGLVMQPFTCLSSLGCETMLIFSLSLLAWFHHFPPSLFPVISWIRVILSYSSPVWITLHYAIILSQKVLFSPCQMSGVNVKPKVACPLHNLCRLVGNGLYVTFFFFFQLSKLQITLASIIAISLMVPSLWLHVLTNIF